MTDLLAGVVQLKLDTYATSNPQVAAGKLRMLGIASRAPLQADAGHADHRRDGPARLRGHPLDRAHGAGRHAESRDRQARRSGAKAARAPDLVARLQSDGVELIGSTPAELGALIARELPQWRDLAKAANIKLQ